MTRISFAESIASGLAGWFQQLAAQNLEHQVGEDAARVELVRMISAQRAYVPETAQRPTNWPATTKKRIDVAVLGRRSGAQGWYGAVEMKWPGSNFDVKQIRQAIVEDAVRVAFAQTSNLYANFLVIGGTSEAIKKLFDISHPSAKKKEAARLAFSSLLSRDLTKPISFLSNSELNTHFPDFGDRIPQATFAGWSRRLKTELVTVAKSTVGATEKGVVYIWQCKR